MRTPTLLASLALSLAAWAGTPPTPAMLENLSRTPAGFEENKGQVRTTDGEPAPFVRYRLSQGSTQLFLLGNGIAYQFSRTHLPAGYSDLMSRAQGDASKLKELDALREQIRMETFRMDMVLVGADPNARISTEGRSNDYTQYYNHDALDVRTYTKVTYHEVYPGIDWVVYTTEKGMKYDFVVHPGADPDLIRMRFEHYEELSIDADGNLIHGNRMGRFTEEPPVSFQDGEVVPTRFVLEGNSLRFAMEDFDSSRVLTIDPARLWGTYYGGSGLDYGWSCSADASGNVFLAGFTESTNGIASGGHQIVQAGASDAFLVKFNSSGTRLWGTYYGGSDFDLAFHCAPDASGNVFLAGTTRSLTGISSGGHQNTYANGGDDGFLVKFNASGTRLWATYYGGPGNDRGFHCAVDPFGNVFLSGETNSTTAIAASGHQSTFGGGDDDGFLVKFSPTGTRLWGTYYGGGGLDTGEAGGVDGSGNVYIAGWTTSSTGIASGGHQNTYAGGGGDAYLAKFTPSGSLAWGTYYGSAAYDRGFRCGVETNGNVFLIGETASTTAIASGGHQNTYGGGAADAFIAKFSTTGTRLWGSYYGGPSNELGYSCVVDANGNSFLAGYTSSTSDIASNGHQNTYGGGTADAYLVKFAPNGTRLWGTYYGGSGVEGGPHDGFYSNITVQCAVDQIGNVYLSATTNSITGIHSGGHQSTLSGDFDAFLVKFEDRSILTGSVNGPICTGHPVTVPFTVSGAFNAGNTFTAQLSDAFGSFASPVDIGTLSGTTSGTINAIVPLGTAPGTGYRIRVVGNNPVVNGSDNGANLNINDATTNCSCDDLVEVEPNNSTAATNALSYDTPISGITGPCSVADNTADYFSFTANTQGVLYVEACLASTGPDPLPVNFRLISSTGATLETFVLQAGANNAPNTDEFYFPCLGIGSYRIAVDNPSTTACTHYTLSYTILEPVFGNDPEPNDAIGVSATPVAHDTYQEGRIGFLGETTYDYFSITPPTNGVMNIEVQAEHVNETPWLMTVQLLSNTGSVLQTWNDVVIGTYSEPATTNLSIPCRSTMNNYHIRISSEGCGISYRFKYSMDAPHFAVDVEPNNTTPGTALEHDTFTEGQIQFDGESIYDHFSITPPTNGVMTFSLEAEHVDAAPGTMHLALLNSAGVVQQTWDLIVGANGLPADSVFSITCRATSNYSVRLSSTTCGVSYRFKYTMTAPHFAADAEPNNTPPGAALAHDTYAEGQVQFDGDTYDHFSISPPTNGVVTFMLEAEHVGAAPGAMQLALLNSAGTVQQTWDLIVGANGLPADSVFSITCRSTENPYTVRISATSCGVSYRWKYTMTAPHFAADVEPNNTQPGTILDHDTYTEGQIQFDAENQYDIYRIAPATNGVMTFTIEAEHVGATEGTMTLALLNSAGTVQQSWNVPVGANSAPAATTMSIICRSTVNPYSIRLSSATCGVSYRVKYTMTAPLFATDAEPNNMAPGIALAPDTYTEGHLQFDAENANDFYRIVPSTDGMVNIEVQAEHVGATPGTITLAFMSGVTVQQSWNIPIGTNGVPVTTTVSFTCRTGGAGYDLRLSTTTCGTSYKLKYTLAPPTFANDTEPNGSTASAIILPEGQTTDGRLNFASENLDTYRLNLSSDGVLNVNLQAEHAGIETNATITAELYVSTGTVLQSWTAPIGANSIPINTQLDRLCLGINVNYYLRISSSICLTSYSLSYTVTPPVFPNDAEGNNGTPGGGGPAVAHDTYQDGHLEFNGNTTNDLYNIIPPINGVMQFEVQAEHAGTTEGTMELRLYSSAGITIQFWTIPVGANGLPVTSTVSISCRGSSTDYDVRLSSTTCGTSYRWKYTMLPAFFPTDAEPNNGTPGSVGSPVAHDTYQDGQIGFDAQTGNDLYNIVAPTNGVMNFEVQAEHAGPVEGSMEFRIYTTAGTTIQLWTVPVGANGVPITSTFSITCRGNTTDYDIGINGVTCGTSYRWKYAMTAPLFANDAEPNGSTSQAIVLPPSTLATGQLNFNAGENTDYYRINMPHDGVLTVSIEAEHTGATTTETLDARILLSTGTTLASWTATVGANSTPESTSFSLPCRGTAVAYYLDLGSNVCGTSYRVSWTATAPLYANDPEPNNSTPGTPMNLNNAEQQGHIAFHNTTDDDYYAFTHPGGPWSVTVSAEHANAGEGTLGMRVINNPGTVFGVFTVPVGGASTPLTNTFTIPSLPAGTIYRLVMQDQTCGVSYRIHCYDSDGDGTCNGFDLCANGPEPGAPCDDNDPSTINDVITSGCTCLGTAATVSVPVRVMLEGPYNAENGLMSDALRSLPAFPVTDPYPGSGYVHTGGGNSGSISPAVLAVSGDDAIVDWVVLELRSAVAPATVVASRSALLQRDGDVVEIDGVTPVAFTVNTGLYHVSVRHRNHLGAMTKDPVMVSAGTVLLDFSDPALETYGMEATKSISGSFPAQTLWSGDVSFDGELKYVGELNDRDPILVQIGGSIPTSVLAGVYSTADCNLDGNVMYVGGGNDRDPILVNIGGSVPTNTRVEQLP